MRNLTAAFIAQLLAKVKSPVIFYQGEFASGTVYFWSGLGTIPWDGQTWTGAGHIAKISQISENSEVRSDGLIITLSGISEELRSIVLQEAQQGKPGIVYIGFMDDSGDIVADPANAFDGRLDVPRMKDSGGTIAISLAYENRLRDLERLREFRYTDQSQRIVFPDDRGFEFVASIQDWSGTWGRA